MEAVRLGTSYGGSHVILQRHLATETDPAFAHEANNIFHGTSLDPTQASSSVLESELQSEDISNSGYSAIDDDSVGLSHHHGGDDHVIIQR